MSMKQRNALAFHHRGRALTWVVLALSMSACAPNLGPLPGFADISGMLAPQSLKAAPVEWPSNRWWEKYNDPQLNTLVQHALAHAPDMSIARARLNQAAAVARQQGAVLYPSLQADASIQSVRQSYNNGAPPGAVPQGWNDTGQATLSLTYQLDFWGKNRALLAAATSQAQAAAAEAEQAKLILTTALVQAYAQYAQLSAEHAEAVSDTAVRAATARLMKQRMENGLENLGSVKQAEAQQAGAEAEAEALATQIAQSKHQLAALLGEGPDYTISLTPPSVSISATTGLPLNLETNLLGRRPDIIAARLQAEAAARRIKATKADYYPNINLSAYIGRESLGLELLNKSTSMIGGVGPAINLPIFAGGRIEGGYRLARGQYDEAVATYNKTLANALREVADAAVAQQSLVGQLEKTRQAVEASRQAYTIAHNRYRGGLATYLEVLTAEDKLITARRTLTRLETQSFLLDVALVRALGGGIPQTSQSQTPQESPAS